MGTIVFTVALIATMAFIFVLFAESRNINEIPGVGDVPFVALLSVILLGLTSIFLFMLILLRPWSRSEGGEDIIQFVDEEATVVGVDEEPTTAPAKPLRGGIVPVDLATVPLGARAWGQAEQHDGATIHPFNFPRASKRGVYANDYIDIGGGRRLRLRTLLAAPAGAFRGAVEERPAPRHTPGQKPNESKDDFMKRLEERYRSDNGDGTASVVRGDEEAFFDYTGDIHDVIDVEGIGPVYADKLKAAGIETTARLCYEDAERLSRVTGAPRKTVESWQAMAELMKVNGIGQQYAEALARAGISGISELKKRSAQVIADQVNEYLDGLDSSIVGNEITPRRVERWKAAASDMRRVKLAIPER